MARLAAALIALIAWTGLAVQFNATHAMGYSVPETLWVLVRFFTILTNVLLAIVMTLVALGRRVSPFLLGGTAMAILLVGIVYITLLRGLLELSGGALLADMLLHKVTPVLAALWWLAFAPKGRLTHRAPVAWALYPLAYFPYALARGAAEGTYAYPFINVDKLGWSSVLINAVMIAVAFLIAGFALVALDRRLGASGRKS